MDSTQAVGQVAPTGAEVETAPSNLATTGDIVAPPRRRGPGRPRSTARSGSSLPRVAGSAATTADGTTGLAQPAEGDERIAAPTASMGSAAVSVVNSAPAGEGDVVAQSRLPEFRWDCDQPSKPQIEALFALIRPMRRLFMRPDGGMVELVIGAEPRHIRDITDLEAFLCENFVIEVIKKGKVVDNFIPSRVLKIVLRSIRLKANLPVVDKVVDIPTFNSRWELTQPGYNDGPVGERYFYAGSPAEPALEPKRIREFIGAMPFKSEADGTNAVAFAITVIVIDKWPGQKPIVLVSGNKSHCGKDTTIDFGFGRTRRAEISWHYRDWALQNEGVAALADPNVRGLIVGNIRSCGQIIESAYLERTITSSSSLMQSSKRRGDGYRREGDFLTAATVNNGRFSIDLANRSLPIRLELVGDIQNRKSPIGDPRREFLPQHQMEIEAEVLGLVENWKAQGCPLDTSVKHPMKDWAQTVGGILKANGFQNFLGNWTLERNVTDAVREALGYLADAAHQQIHKAKDGWFRVADLVKIAIDEGVLGALVESRHQKSDKAMERQLGVILTNHRDETVFVEDDGQSDTLVVRGYTIRKARNESHGILAIVYRFDPVASKPNTAAEQGNQQ